MSRAIVAYVPVLHRGYYEFITTHWCTSGHVYLMGKDIVSNCDPSLARKNLAALPEEIILKAVRTFDSFVSILDNDNIQEPNDCDEIIMPDENLMHTVAEKYFDSKKCRFVKTFLRYDKKRLASEQPISSSVRISEESEDRYWICHAMELALESKDWWRQVGAVIVVKKDVVLAEACNVHKPERSPETYSDPRLHFSAGERTDLTTALHAEAGAIAKAARRGGILEGADLYVTTFPCGGCARIISETGIRRVFFADGYSSLDGERVLLGAGIELIQVK